MRKNIYNGRSTVFDDWGVIVPPRRRFRGKGWGWRVRGICLTKKTT